MIEHFYNKTYVIWRPALTTDGQGGWTEALVAQANVAGLMSTSSMSRYGADRIRVGQREAVITHVFYCDYNADVNVNDEIRNGGNTWTVLSISEPGNQDRHMQCLCELRRNT